MSYRSIKNTVFTVAFLIAASVFQGPVYSTGEIAIREIDTSSVLVKTPSFEVKFDLKTAALSSIRLTDRKFSDELLSSWQRRGGALPFTLVTGTTEVTGWKMDTLKETGGKVSLIFSCDNLYGQEDTLSAHLSGVGAVKQFTFDVNLPEIEVKVKLLNRSRERVLLEREGYSYELVIMANLEENAADDEIVYFKDGTMHKTSCRSEGYCEEIPSKIDWIGVKDNFYAAVTKISGSGKASFRARYRAGDARIEHDERSKNGYHVDARLRFAPLILEPGQTKEEEFFFVSTVKSYEVLKRYGLENIAELGTLSLFMMGLLKLFYSLTKNWGLSIILLTIFVRIVMHPLNEKQMKNMKEMQKLQPFINELKKKYGSDPRRFNEEVMRLYREHRVNPLGGCLPLLVQLPILFALFTALRSSIEFKGEAFLWLRDLSAPDHLLILPVGIAVLTHIQQQQMSMDPDQARMMAFMPVLLFFITYQFPSGVLLYWALSQLLQSSQQGRIMKKEETSLAADGSRENRGKK